MKFWEKNGRGQSLVEFSLVLPIFLTLIFGLVQASIVFGSRIVVTSAAKEAVRMVAVGDSDEAAKNRVMELVGLVPFAHVNPDDIIIEPGPTLRRENVEISIVIPAHSNLIVPFPVLAPGSTYNFSSSARMRYDLSDSYSGIVDDDDNGDDPIDAYLIFVDVFTLERSGDNLMLTVAISDGLGDPLEEATVYIEIYKGNNLLRTGNFQTDIDGTAITYYAPGSPVHGFYEAKIIDIVKSDYTFDGINWTAAYSWPNPGGVTPGGP